jgi:recombination protein RecT
MANQVATTGAKAFSTFLSQEAVKHKINAIIGDSRKGTQFITSLTSAVTMNPSIAECDHATIINVALQGVSLNLNPSSSLGEFFIVPFNDRKNNRKVATFQMGWKGYIQLALRTGQYKTINAVEIKKGELKRYDRLTDEIVIEWLDDTVRDKTETSGYVAVIELVNGFRKTLYWSRDKMENHALQYSETYKADKRNGYGYSLWSKNFDAMGIKTVLRQLLDKYGVKSTELAQALEKDMAVIDDEGKAIYIDNNGEVTEPVKTATEVPSELKETPKASNITKQEVKTEAPKTAPKVDIEF